MECDRSVNGDAAGAAAESRYMPDRQRRTGCFCGLFAIIEPWRTTSAERWKWQAARIMAPKAFHTCDALLCVYSDTRLPIHAASKPCVSAPVGTTNNCAKYSASENTVDRGVGRNILHYADALR